MLKAIAVDDEPVALEVIRMHVAQVHFMDLQASFVDALEALDYLDKNEVDVIFLDIRMPDISGIDFYNRLEKKPLLILTTAYPEHAITGFELEAVDYLLKPFAFARFLKACEKAYDIWQKDKDEADHIFIKDGFKIVKIKLEEVLFLEAAGNYVKFVMKDSVVMARSTIKDALKLLPTNRFVQVHRSYIVNKQHLDRIERHQINVSGNLVPVGSSFVGQVR